MHGLVPSPLAAAPLRWRPVAFARVSPVVYVLGHVIAIPALLAITAWQVQHGPLDWRFALWMIDAAASEPAVSPWLELLGHEAARAVPIAVGALALVACLLPRWRSWQPILATFAVALVVAPLLVNALKMLTSQHCPTQILELGGTIPYAVDQAAPFWAATRESAGRCLPSGHASGGYALLALYFAGWASGRPAWRWSGLAVGVALGLVFSFVRIAQGAHFTSATLWSATIDWMVCALCFMPLLCRPRTAR